MQLKQLFTKDDRGATPVIGIVLMVAIAVILAALVSTQTLALSRQSAEAGPSAVIQFDYDTTATGADAWSNADPGDPAYGLLTITHEGGESIPMDRLSLIGVDGAAALGFTAIGGDDYFDAGDEVTVWVHEDDTVRVVWDSREGTKSTAVAIWSDS